MFQEVEETFSNRYRSPGCNCSQNKQSYLWNSDLSVPRLPIPSKTGPRDVLQNQEIGSISVKRHFKTQSLIFKTIR